MAVDPFFTATPAQSQFADAVFSGQYRFMAYGGGIRSGKSATSIILVQALCRIFPGSRWAIVRKDLPTLKRNVLPTFAKFRIQGFTGDINKDTWTAKCANGSEIVFFTESISEDPDLNRWRGLEVNGFFLEEANELQEVSWNKAIERAGAWVIPRTAVQPPPLIVATFNPSAGWVKRVFYDPWKAGTIKAPFYYQPATILDNPHIPAEYVENLSRLPERDKKRFVEGDWSFISGAFFDELSAETHACPSLGNMEVADPFMRWHRIPDWWTSWGAFDWGFRHPAVFMAFTMNGDGQVYWLDTLRMHRLDDEAQARKIQERMPRQCLSTVYAGHDAFDKRMAHSAATESVSDVFGRSRIYLTKANTARVQGWSAVRRSLTPKQPDGSRGTPRVLICETPGNLWAMERILDLVPDETDPEDVKKVDANEDGAGGDDAADCLRYGLSVPALASKSPPESDRAGMYGRDPRMRELPKGGWVGPEADLNEQWTGGFAATLPVNL